jgi:hypothetical protein
MISRFLYFRIQVAVFVKQSFGGFAVFVVALLFAPVAMVVFVDWMTCK